MSPARSNALHTLGTIAALILSAGGIVAGAAVTTDHTKDLTTRVQRLEDHGGKTDLDVQKLRDDMDHLVETVDRIDQGVQHLQQQKGGR